MTPVFRLLEFIRRPVPFAIILLVFAAAFTWIDREASQIEEKCRDQLSLLADHRMSNRLDEIDISILKLQTGIAEIRLQNMKGPEAKEIRKANRELSARISRSESGLGDLGRESSELRNETEQVCSAAESLAIRTAFSALLMTLLAGAFGFWVGMRKA